MREFVLGLALFDMGEGKLLDCNLVSLSKEN